MRKLKINWSFLSVIKIITLDSTCSFLSSCEKNECEEEPVTGISQNRTPPKSEDENK